MNNKPNNKTLPIAGFVLMFIAAVLYFVLIVGSIGTTTGASVPIILIAIIGGIGFLMAILSWFL